MDYCAELECAQYVPCAKHTPLVMKRKAPSHSAENMSVATWNIAAVNNNPFEYWITHEDEHYSALMGNVQEFVSEPGARDVSVGSVFSPAMFGELKGLLQQTGWGGLDEVEAIWNNDLKQRNIISGFLTDNVLGKKRLASMPDRMTNTVNTADGGTLFRPTVINCYEGDLGAPDKWWNQWKTFMFDTEISMLNRKTKTISNKKAYQLLAPIKHSKYPDISEKEEAISLPLQTVCCAIFDAIMVHIMNTLAPDTWQALRTQMCEALNKNKVARTLQILDEQYGTSDVILLQEVSTAFADKAASLFGPRMEVHCPSAMDGVRDQNSVILTKSGAFTDFEEVTDVVSKQLAVTHPKAPVAAGDIFVLSAKAGDTPYLLASFHGDTNGLATIPVLTALHETAKTSFPGHRLLFGLDANTHKKHSAKAQGVYEFVTAFQALGMESSWGPKIDAGDVTTFNARTYLQPQLNKAIKMSEKLTKGDRNLKDYVLFYDKDFTTTSNQRDNTGRGEFVDKILPSLDFPSDHCILTTQLTSSKL